MKTLKNWYRWSLQGGEGLQTFKGIPKFLTEIWPYQILISWRIILWRHKSVNRANVVSKLIQIWKFINFWKKFREIIFANRHLLGSKQEFNFANLTKLSSRENFFPQGNIFGLSRFASTARKSYICKDKTISTFQKSAYPTFQLNKVIIERWKTWTY